LKPHVPDYPLLFSQQLQQHRSTDKKIYSFSKKENMSAYVNKHEKNKLAYFKAGWTILTLCSL